MNKWCAFDITTLGAVESLVCALFSEGADRTLRRILSNPLLGDGDSAGDCVYDDGELVGFQAAIKRCVYWRDHEYRAVAGSTLCLSPQANPELLSCIISRTVEGHDADIYFGNTVCRAAMRLNKMYGVDVANLSSYQHRSVRRCGMLKELIWCIECALTRISRRMVGFSRPREGALKMGRYTVYGRFRIDDEKVDKFWRDYLDGNKGFVSSRSSQELNWVHGDELTKKKRLFLGVEQMDEIVGYVIVRVQDPRFRKWEVVDWIAMGNDMAVLDGVMRCAVRYMLKFTGATRISIAGFCSAVQELVHKYFPVSVQLGKRQNYFCFRILNEGLARNKGALDTLDSWFFGPYDGDECLL